ncbi:unnamed protein product [Sphenostylis stenocarpa]|uniref:Uncharacterized protein n=1 Tax=Sphenostylis stenocarpa TaxID=92480 RepID=A0AA86S1M3_9FABA|nr:unnamed protein product [Sphenostylis stenocarpa]
MRSTTNNPLVVGRVIGDVLEPFSCSVPLRVVYDNNKQVINSGELKPSQVINQPKVEVGGDDLRTLYTLVMVDPDAPSPRQEIVSYESPRPTSGIHRLIFVLFRQPCRQSIHAPGWRQNFISKDFAEYYNLGSPVAAVYFNCQRQGGSGVIHETRKKDTIKNKSKIMDIN